ncbi:glycosyl hydrolases family 31-domain-containing protein [Halteromyces radiatus]|uniref:glycosyl hydrolases family 31-domain-containing protein n=1 Tax=Halteromyces radiatus TaxID=101107 RepID=UPI002220F81C|nr:glycosyl hydrolases family 31-domain-containing protein [Halteromyces radiatus]KAI8097398.1 glycosyl hydrolases family 31-domain-containing protein [Halteromyces radiatus]
MVQVTTDAIEASITLSPFGITWRPLDEKDWFAQDLAYRSYCYDPKHGTRWHYQRRRTTSQNTFYYGLGEHTGRLNLDGRRFRLERMDTMGYDAETQDPLYKFCPFYIGLSNISSLSVYGVYYNNFGRTLLDMGQERDAMWGDYTYYQVEKGPLDYYMIYGGKSIAKVVQTFNKMMGGYSLMPRSMFGYLASAMGYAEQDNAQELLEQFVDKCRQQYKLPCDGMHLSSGYTVDSTAKTEGDRWVFTWNKRRFPDPARLAKVYRDAGMKIFANVKPWLLTNHPDYNKVASEHGFVWDEARNGPSLIWQWRGGRNTKGQASYIDFSSDAGYRYWQDNLTSALLRFGFDIWLDNNEFTMMDDESQQFQCQRTCDGFPSASIDIPCRPSRINNGWNIDSPVQTLLMIQASYEAVRRHLPEERPCLITRSTVPFSQLLVAQTWSGDNYTSWKTLAYNISMGIGAGLCSMPAGYGHDVAGFSGPPPTPEQLVRWVQQGVFWTRFCIHSWNSDKSITEPWMYPQIFPTIRSSFEWRYRWLPHLYSLYVTLAYRNNEPVVRPTFYDHPHDRNTYEQDFEFMVGSQLLVAPVYEQDKLDRHVYLPSFYYPSDNNGVNTTGGWYHYQTGQYYSGGQWITVPSVLEDALAPLFIKEGSFMCYGKSMAHVHALPDNERRIHIYPDVINQDDRTELQTPYRWTFKLVEDDGHSIAHQQQDIYTDIELWMECYMDRLLVGINILYDGYFPEYDTLWVTCPLACETRPLVFADDPDGSFYTSGDGGEQYLRIKMVWAK